jgi:TRAP-type C4-dicarboxylate transport system permease small subunit
MGGLLALSIAVLVTINVLGRWLFSSPVNGDIELVQVGTAVAIFAYMPYTQARRGNIMVDTFTGFLPQRARNLIDAFWDLVFAAFMAFCSVGLSVGTREFLANNQSTPQLLIPVWPIVALCALLAALIALTAILTAVRLWRGG